MEKRDIEATRNALLDAAEKLMTECDDPSQVTSRAITKEAGVNLAMINYCFGSREGLLFAIFSKLQSDAMKCDRSFERVLGSDMTPKEKLVEVHFRSMRIMLKHFKFIKAVTKYVLLNREISSERGSLVFIEEHFGGRKTPGQCRLIAHELSCLHQLAVLRHEEIKEVCGIDLNDDESLRSYILQHVEMFLAEGEG